MQAFAINTNKKSKLTFITNSDDSSLYDDSTESDLSYCPENISEQNDDSLEQRTRSNNCSNSSSSDSISCLKNIDFSLIIGLHPKKSNANDTKITNLQNNIEVKYSTIDSFHYKDHNNCTIALSNKKINKEIVVTNYSRFIKKMESIISRVITDEVKNSPTLGIHKIKNNLNETKLTSSHTTIDIMVHDYIVKYHIKDKALTINMSSIDQGSTIYLNTIEKISSFYDFIAMHKKILINLEKYLYDLRNKKK